jgi:dTDP-4-amino-4,6-dideoxygalactose transaminase
MKIRVGDFKTNELERTKINQILDSDIISEGRNVREFEKEWADYIGTKYSILLNSGTSAFGCIATQQPVYIKYYKKLYKDRLPNAEYIGNNGFYIGCHQYLSEEDLGYIYKSFKEILK